MSEVERNILVRIKKTETKIAQFVIIQCLYEKTPVYEKLDHLNMVLSDEMVKKTKLPI